MNEYILLYDWAIGNLWVNLSYSLSQRFASERDFVASYVLPRMKEAARVIGVADVVDFHVEKPIDGTPDLMAEKAGRRLFIVEAKFKKKVGRIERDIEPRDPEVIDQAVDYAVKGGFPYYATCNSRRFVLFQLRPGVKAYESEIASFEYERTPEWAENALKTVLELIPIRLKPLDDTLVDMLHEAFNDLYPEFLSALKGRLRDNRFKGQYIDWLESQGARFTDEVNRLIAEQTAYLQLNKLLFYQVIRTIYPDRLEPLKIDEDKDVSDALAGFFAEARRIDYAPIYQSDIMSEIPLTPRAKERIRTLLDTLNEFDFSRVESDFIGRIYEKLIPPLERKRLGQFYTPLGIVDFIVQLTVTKPNDVVLDPGCGSGSFLVRAYHRLRELNHIQRVIEGPLSEKFHQQLLEQLYGVDINQFPAHLTVINLAVQNPKARIKKVNAVVKDIFDIRPGQATLSGFESLTTEGKTALVEVPPTFDVVVANPPYIEQELLGDKEKRKIKALIEEEYKEKLFIGAALKTVKDAIILDKQSDIYIYFYIHGVRFLKNGGRLGFISSNKWLEVDYGLSFQQFLLANTKILYIVEFDRAMFPDAEVNAAVTILEKESNKEKRNENTVKFIRVKKKMDLNTQLKLIQEAKEGFEDDHIRVNLVRQRDLTGGKWNIYLRAPPIFQRIVSNTKVRSLNSIAEVFRGPTTGCDEFFILSRDKAVERSIEPQFLTLCVSSPKKVKRLITEKEKIQDYLFTVDMPMSDLRGTNALKYINYGESLEVEPKKGSHRKKRRVPELETLKCRQLWYKSTKFQIAPILLVKMMDKRPKAIWNQARAHASNLFYYIIPKKREDELPLLGFLNSSLGAFLSELYGRSYGGGVLELAAYELKRMPVIDPSMLSKKESSGIEDAFRALIKAEERRIKVEDKLEAIKPRSEKERGLFEAESQRELEKVVKAEEEARTTLDEAVYDALGLSREERRQVEESLKELQELRRLRTQA